MKRYSIINMTQSCDALCHHQVIRYVFDLILGPSGRAASGGGDTVIAVPQLGSRGAQVAGRRAPARAAATGGAQGCKPGVQHHHHVSTRSLILTSVECKKRIFKVNHA